MKYFHKEAGGKWFYVEFEPEDLFKTGMEQGENSPKVAEWLAENASNKTEIIYSGVRFQDKTEAMMFKMAFS